MRFTSVLSVAGHLPASGNTGSRCGDHLFRSLSLRSYGSGDATSREYSVSGGLYGAASCAVRLSHLSHFSHLSHPRPLAAPKSTNFFVDTTKDFVYLGFCTRDSKALYIRSF